jgi:hypothetical protein
MVSKLTPAERLFCGVYPCGFVYADRGREKAGDFARLAFLPFDTLEPAIEKDCPAEMRPLVESDIQRLQACRGEEYQVSTSGQTVTLGTVKTSYWFGREAQAAGIKAPVLDRDFMATLGKGSDYLGALNEWHRGFHAANLEGKVNP